MGMFSRDFHSCKKIMNQQIVKIMGKYWVEDLFHPNRNRFRYKKQKCEKINWTRKKSHESPKKGNDRKVIKEEENLGKIKELSPLLCKNLKRILHAI